MSINQAEQLGAIDIESSILSLSDVMPNAADGFNTILEGVGEYRFEFLRKEDVSRIKQDVSELLECWFKDYFLPEHAKLYGKHRDNASDIVKEIAGFLSQNKSLWPFFSDFFREKFQIVIKEAPISDPVPDVESENSVADKVDKKVRQYSCTNRVLEKRQILQFFNLCGLKAIPESGKGRHMGVYFDGKRVGGYSGGDGVRIRAIIDQFVENGVPLSVFAEGYNKTFGSGFVILT